MLWTLISEDGMVEIVATDWSWKMTDGRLVPVMTDQDIAPNLLTNVIRSKCKVSKVYFYHLKILIGLAKPIVILVKIFLGTFVNTACDLRLEFFKCKSWLGTSDIVLGVIHYFWMILKLPHLHVIQTEYSMIEKFCVLLTFTGRHLMPWKAPDTSIQPDLTAFISRQPRRIHAKRRNVHVESMEKHACLPVKNVVVWSVQTVR